MSLMQLYVMTRCAFSCLLFLPFPSLPFSAEEPGSTSGLQKGNSRACHNRALHTRPPGAVSIPARAPGTVGRKSSLTSPSPCWHGGGPGTTPTTTCRPWPGVGPGPLRRRHRPGRPSLASAPRGLLGGHGGGRSRTGRGDVWPPQPPLPRCNRGRAEHGRWQGGGAGGTSLALAGGRPIGGLAGEAPPPTRRPANGRARCTQLPRDLR